jgi:disulfide bond formation protein DsbB
LIAFVGGLGLLTAALLSTKVFPVLSTVTAIVAIAAMIYGLAAGVMIVLNGDNEGSPD